MSLAIRSVSTGGRGPSAGGGPGSIAKPAGCVDGDLLVFFMSSTGSSDVALPAGFTLLQDKTGSTASAICGYKVASGEPSSYGFSGNSNAGLFAVMYCIKGQDLTAPIDGSTSASGSSTTASAASVTPTAANGLALIYVGANGNVTFSGETVATSPPTFVEDGEGAATGVPGDLAYVAASGIRAAATATGASSVTLSGSQAWSTFLVYVKAQPDQAPAAPLFLAHLQLHMFPHLMQTFLLHLNQLPITFGNWKNLKKRTTTYRNEPKP